MMAQWCMKYIALKTRLIGQMMSAIRQIYTDGACSGNPGPGGWGVVIYFMDDSVYELGGSELQTTNNRMELQAAIAALEFIQQSGQTQSLELFTDSEYVKNGITKWIRSWKQKGWITAAGKPVLNQDLWQELDLLNGKQVTWRYVRGHAGNQGNERCDAIARAFSLGKTPALRQNAAAASQKLSGGVPKGAAAKFDLSTDSTIDAKTLKSTTVSVPTGLMPDSSMSDSSLVNPSDSLEELPREVRVAHLQHVIETLTIADQIANKGYLITSSELADLMDVNASAVTSRGDNWVWRNWVVSRVRREGNQILWQLERVD